MASAVIGALRVLLGMDTAQFDQGVKSVQGKLGVLGSAFKRFAGGVIGTVSLGGIAIGFQKIANHMEEMGAAAQRLGVPVRELTRLKLAAELSEVSFEQLGTSISRLSRNLTAAASGASNDASRALRSLGIDATETGLSVTDILVKLADQFQRMPDGFKKTGIAMTLFSRAGQMMIPLLNQGGAAIREMMLEADQLGLTLDRHATDSADRFNDAIDKIRGAILGFMQQVVLNALPGLTKLAEKIVDFAKDSNNAVAVGQAFSNFLKNIAGDAMRAASAIKQIMIVFSALKAIVAAIGTGQQLNIAEKAFADFRAEGERLQEAIKELNTQTSTGRAHLRTLADTAHTTGEEITLVTAASEKAAASFKKMFINLQQQTAGLATQAQSIGLTAGALARLTASQDFYNQAQDQGIKLTAAQTQMVEQQLDRIAASTQRLEALQGVYDTLSSGLSSFTDGLLSAAQGTESFGQVFKQTIEGIIQDLARLFLNRFFQMLLGSGFQGLFGGGGGPTNIVPSGFRQSGGSVSRGHPVLVGERGPELWRPGHSGSIVPNSQLGASVNIIDQRTTAAPPVEARTGADGSQEFVIRDTIRRQLPNELNRLMPAQFGAKPRLNQRGS